MKTHAQILDQIKKIDAEHRDNDYAQVMAETLEWVLGQGEDSPTDILKRNE